MLRKWFLALLCGLFLPVFPAFTAVAPQAQARVSARVYRVWLLRHNRYTGRSWWEVYTTTNNQDRAQRVVNALEQLGYRAYWD